MSKCIACGRPKHRQDDCTRWKCPGLIDKPQSWLTLWGIRPPTTQPEEQKCAR